MNALDRQPHQAAREDQRSLLREHRRVRSTPLVCLHELSKKEKSSAAAAGRGDATVTSNISIKLVRRHPETSAFLPTCKLSQRCGNSRQTSIESVKNFLDLLR